MMVRKVVISSALGLGMSAMAFAGMGTASAAPGISFDNGDGPVGIGDNSAKGAQATAAKGNNALAVSIFSNSRADAQGTGNNVVAIDGHASTGKNTEKNNVLSVGGITTVRDNASHNNVVTVLGVTDVKGDSNHNNIVNVGGFVQSANQGKAPGALSVSLCGTSLTGQADHIKTSDAVCGTKKK